MQLPPHQQEFLIKYKHRLKERMFLIDLMTQVEGRPSFPLYKSEAITPQKMSSRITLSTPPEDRAYIKLPDESITDEHLKEATHQGLALVYPYDSSVYEMLIQYRNYMCLDDDHKAESDKMAKELYGRTNPELFDYFISPQYNETHFDKCSIKDGTIIQASVVNTDQICVVYISDINLQDRSFTLNYLSNGLQRVMGEIDTFDLTPGAAVNCKAKMTTTVGRFLLNYLLIEEPFGDPDLPYQNSVINLKMIEPPIARGLLDGKYKVDQYKKYVNNLFFIGHFCELCVPTYSRKSLTTDPNVAKVKRELMEKYKGRLNDPNVIIEIENKLIAMDKAYLKDDVSMRFYGALDDKIFNTNRKKLFLTVGGVEKFTKTTGNYEFIANSLTEGMTPEAMPAMSNESRKGSFNRGHQTAQGGMLTKYISRVMQDLIISEQDCHTTKGLEVDFSRYSVERYVGSYVQSGTSWVLLTKENMDKFNGRKCVVRSPMYCQAKHGLCYMCMGEVYAKMDAKHLAMDAVDITSTFTTNSLKAMHGTKLEMYHVDSLSEFVLN